MTRPILLIAVARASSLFLCVILLPALARRLGTSGCGTSRFGPAVSLTVGGWVTSTISIVRAGRWSRFLPRFRPGIPSTILRSLPLGAAAIAITVYYSFDIILLGAFRGSEEVAFYSAAYRIIL